MSMIRDNGPEAESEQQPLVKIVKGSPTPEEVAALITVISSLTTGNEPPAERGYVDAVIAPSETRAHVIRALRQLRTKRESLPPKKHGNIPL